MSNILVQTGDESITLSGPAARREAAAYLAAFRGENGAPAWPGLPMLGRFITNFGLRAVHFH